MIICFSMRLKTWKAIYIGDTLEYACCFWISRLVRTTTSSLDVEEVYEAIEKFFTAYFLFWIEVLSLAENFDVGVYVLNNIQQWYLFVSDIILTTVHLYSCSFRQEFPASRLMTASIFSWETLTEFIILLFNSRSELCIIVLAKPRLR